MPQNRTITHRYYPETIPGGDSVPTRFPLTLELVAAPDPKVLAAAYQRLADWIREYEAPKLGPQETGGLSCE